MNSGVSVTEDARMVVSFLSACAMKWNQLQNENAPLRAMLNGKLQSVSEDIYDRFILREIAEQPEQFKMAIVIGNVLGKYQLGISDVWISNSIDVHPFLFTPRICLNASTSGFFTVLR